MIGRRAFDPLGRTRAHRGQTVGTDPGFDVAVVLGVLALVGRRETDPVGTVERIVASEANRGLIGVGGGLSARICLPGCPSNIHCLIKVCDYE